MFLHMRLFRMRDSDVHMQTACESHIHVSHADLNNYMRSAYFVTCDYSVCEILMFTCKPHASHTHMYRMRILIITCELWCSHAKRKQAARACIACVSELLHAKRMILHMRLIRMRDSDVHMQTACKAHTHVSHADLNHYMRIPMLTCKPHAIRKWTYRMRIWMITCESHCDYFVCEMHAAFETYMWIACKPHVNHMQLGHFHLVHLFSHAKMYATWMR